MTRPRVLLAVFAFTLTMGSLGCMSGVKTSADADAAGAAADRRELEQATIEQWSDMSALAARTVTERYGVPDEVRPQRLIWNGRNPWRRTVVRNVPTPYAVGVETGMLAQTIATTLTPKQAADIAAFDRNISYDDGASELTARSDREEVNLLRLNLAGDVAAERLSPEQARDSYASILLFEASGKVSPYLQTLRFGR